jgi:probable phosphoglycerate mutase
VPITETGARQAEEAAAWIAAQFRPARLVTSPFRRARQTADILAARLGLAPTVEDDLREQSFGSLAGQPYASLRACADYDPASYWLWCPPGGGETLVQVAARAGAVLDRIVRALPDEDAVVVSHGGVMMALWRHVTGSWRTGRVARNAGLVVVEHAGDRYASATAIDEA